MIVHIFCLPMHLYHHMYKRLCIGRHWFHNVKVTYTTFITVLWIVHVQIFKTLEWKKLLETKIKFWVLMKKKLACPPRPVSSSIYIYILRLRLTLISTMRWHLPLICGVSVLSWLHWNATLFYLNHRFEVAATLRGKLVLSPNVKNIG